MSDPHSNGVDAVRKGYWRTVKIISWSAAAIAALSIVAYVVWVGSSWPISNDSAYWANLGDYIGGVVGTVISAATLALVGLTVLLQARLLAETGKQLAIVESQLRIAKDQLEVSRTELQQNRDELKQSNNALRQQVFEATFFRLLEHFRKGVQELQQSGLIGQEAFRAMRESVTKNQPPDVYVVEGLAMATSIYRTHYETWKAQLGPYFRTIYHLLKLVTAADLTPEQKAKYASLLRSQLSSHELVLLFFNCMIEEGFGLKPFVEHYGMLKHLNREKDLPRGLRAPGFYYAEAAFQDFDTRLASGWTMPSEGLLREARGKA